MVVEVMGRHTGWIATYSGMAGGADCILVPERKFNVDEVCALIRKRIDRGREFAIVVVAEGQRLMKRTTCSRKPATSMNSVTRSWEESAIGLEPSSSRRRGSKRASRCWDMSSAVDRRRRTIVFLRRGLASKRSN